MYDTQQALIAHIDSVKDDLGILTVKAYAGEFKDPAKLTNLKPAVFVIYIDGGIDLVGGTFRFDLLVLVDSKTLSAQANAENNLQLSQQIMDWIILHNQFSHLGKHYHIPNKYTDNHPPPQASTLLVDARYNIIAVHLSVIKY